MAVAVEVPVAPLVQPEPIVEQYSEYVTPSAVTGDCASELIKYDWPQADAYKIMFKESTNNPGVINNNPATGDYSVGCFQINLIGNMRNTRPPEAWLLNAKNNVEYAYQMYSMQGRTFCKTSGWFNSCKATGVQ